MPTRSEAAKRERMQIRFTASQLDQLEALAWQFDTTKQSMASWALSLGLKAIQRAWDEGTKDASVQVFESIGPRIGIDPKDLTPEMLERIRAYLVSYREANPE